jgi:hypothetical protein
MFKLLLLAAVVATASGAGSKPETGAGFELIGESKDCCRYNGAFLGGRPFNGAISKCEAGCRATKTCKFFSHHMKYGGTCVLCSKCDFNSDKKGRIYNSYKLKTAAPVCKNKKERHITSTFNYFNSGSATGCEHRHHYLYEYRGSDCIWTSSPTAIRDLGKYTYESMRVEFKVADYGKMEYSDYVKVELAPCLNGKCESFYQTELIRADTKGNLGRRSINDRYHGWYWQTVRQAKGSAANWMDQLDKHHNQIRIRITLKSDDNYNERHILDNLEIKGMACDKGNAAACTAQYCTQYQSGGVFHDRCTVGHPGHNYALEECQQTCGICSTATASTTDASCPTDCINGCWGNPKDPNTCLNPTSGYPNANQRNCEKKGGTWCTN